MTDTETLTARQFQESGGTGDWRVLGAGASAWFGAPSHAAGAALVRRITEAADTPEAREGAVPDIDLRQSGVRVDLPRHGFGAPDVALAEQISAAARELGLTSDPAAVQDLQLAFDVLDQAAVQPFWEAALAYEPVGEEDIVDPLRRHPPIWFQDQDAPRPLRNRVHLDVVTPQPVAERAVRAVRDLGARSVADHDYYATVADAEGNEADLLPLPEGADRWEGAEVEDWRLVFSAMASYPVGSAEQAAGLVEAVAALADEAGLPLGIDLRPGVVTLDSGKDAWEQDDGYRALAGRVQAAARGLGLTADVGAPRFVQVGIDAVDIPAVRAFWAAVLGYEPDPREGVTDLVDPRRLNTVVFFQPMEESETERRAQRNRIHVDLFVPDDQAQARIEAGLAAGGRLAYDGNAPFGWTLADPEGNEVDIAVAVGREEAWRAARGEA
ncbi:VOC family protein [Ornithinicoccus hortensis]|uniref:Glyoxalase-like domain-containing protein n=1 Tax=Ornithinicoccus hortensis TaxID=82346 RepID=A0A542YLR4_9MICO|nr:VOC family protein [Ornithinicoccus hortensis]TQL49018.1 hypothetical protein FB467_0082 [Ornithinicoccus hortensis]